MSPDLRKGFLSRLTQPLRRLGVSETGAAAIEFAFVAPIMILGFFGAWEYSRAFTSEQRVTKIAGSLADLVARSQDPNSATGSDLQITCGSVAGVTDNFKTVFDAADVLMGAQDTTALSITIFNVRAKSDNKLDVEIKWRAFNGRGTITTDQTATTFVTNGKLLVDKTNDEVIVVFVTYQHPFAISILAGGDGVTKIGLSESAPMKPRNGPLRLVSAKNTNVAAGSSVQSGTATCASVKQRASSPY